MTDISTYHDHELLSAISNGDLTGLRKLMQLYFPILSRFAEKYVADTAQAQDIAQETFIKLWNQHRSFNSIQSLKNFLYVTARNASIDAIRRQQRANKRAINFTLLQEEQTRFAIDEIIYAELLVAINKTMLSLPEKMQEIFRLAYIEGLDNQAIADRLQLSQQTVRNQKTRALQIIRQQLAQDNPRMLAWFILFTTTGLA